MSCHLARGIPGLPCSHRAGAQVGDFKVATAGGFWVAAGGSNESNKRVTLPQHPRIEMPHRVVQCRSEADPQEIWSEQRAC